MENEEIKVVEVVEVKKKRKRPPNSGKPVHVPTDKTRAEVMALSSYGVPLVEIAVYIGIGRKTLQKHYRYELDTACTRANAKVAGSLLKSATEGGNVAAQIFWLKTRARWRETDRNHDSEQQTGIDIRINEV